ncbi:TadE/TadG family type IV pilus assembly protein [Mesorhizobium sp. B2-3-10]|uniref:TadE/TadG family type IV pilus assembly protein n=1 Tax=Mesorhizobium sp. B2-3-10 TaxID=2589954 RepID=UPI00112A6804|nr:TadE/TadG family type IV pilus assembly protein [Mesorhizobium sp. B2-3-10]TPL91331.1 pilus assembly protein [Mesorhizobium sp. B2-3-10]
MFIALRQFLRGFHKDEQGAALVEVALVAPFVLLLSAGVFEFSNILNTRLLLEAGVEDGARYMARCNDSNWSTCVTLGTNLAVNGAVTDGSPRVTGWTTPQITVTVAHNQAVDGSGNQLYLSSTGIVDVVQVSTSLPYSGIGLWGYLGFGSLNITASHQERVFGW